MGSLSGTLDGTFNDSLLEFERKSAPGVPSYRHTYIDNMGIVKIGLGDGPRFGFHPISRQPLGLLVEKGSENLMKTTNFSDWRLSGLTIFRTFSAGTSPQGFRSALSLRNVSSANVSAPDSMYYELSPSLLSSGLYVFSFWGKSDLGEESLVSIRIGDIESAFKLTNHWKRHAITVQVEVDNPLQIHFSSVKGESSFGVFLWGPQFEKGAEMTSLIPGFGSIGSRPSERLQINDLSWMYPNEGTWVIRWTQPVVNSDRSCILNISNGTEKESFGLYTGGVDKKTNFFVNLKGVSNRLSGGEQVSLTAFEPKNTVVAFGHGQVVGYENGDSLGRGIIARAPVALDFLTFGYNGHLGENYLNGYIKSIKYYPAKLRDDDLLRLSSQ